MDKLLRKEFQDCIMLMKNLYLLRKKFLIYKIMKNVIMELSLII